MHLQRQVIQARETSALHVLSTASFQLWSQYKLHSLSFHDKKQLYGGEDYEAAERGDQRGVRESWDHWETLPAVEICVLGFD